MKKHIKKFGSFALLLVCVLSISLSTAFAADNSVMQPQYVPVCGQYATHDMFTHGAGAIYNIDTGHTDLPYGPCFQCTRCHLVLVCQNEPSSYSPLGIYTTYQVQEPLSPPMTFINARASDILYASTNSIPGFSFRYI